MDKSMENISFTVAFMAIHAQRKREGTSFTSFNERTEDTHMNFLLAQYKQQMDKEKKK